MEDIKANTPSKVEQYFQKRKEYLEKNVSKIPPEEREVANMPLSKQYKRTSHLQNAGHGHRR